MPDTPDRAALAERLEAVIESLESFGRAYPEDIFPPLTDAERDALPRGTMDRISAAMGRHIGTALARHLPDLHEAAAALAAPAVPRPDSVYPKYTDDRSAVTRIAQVIAHEMGHGGNEEAAARSIVLEVERGWIGFPESSRDATGATVAAPAVPPSVAEAREAVLNEMHSIAAEADGTDQGPTSYEVATRVIPTVDALIAAVRAATVAEAVRVVEATKPRDSALSLDYMGRATLNLFQADAIAALRALGERAP